jgi:hypothetical protein
MGLLFTIAAGSRQRSYSRVRVPRDSLPYFTVSDSRLPQPEGPGPRICIPQEQGGPVISPGTGFPFRRLLRLAGIRWRYSNPLPRTSQKTHYVSAAETNRVMLFRETVAVYCENHKEHTETLCGQNAEVYYVKASGTSSNPRALKS